MALLAQSHHASGDLPYPALSVPQPKMDSSARSSGAALTLPIGSTEAISLPESQPKSLSAQGAHGETGQKDKYKDNGMRRLAGKSRPWSKARQG